MVYRDRYRWFTETYIDGLQRQISMAYRDVNYTDERQMTLNQGSLEFESSAAISKHEHFRCERWVFVQYMQYGWMIPREVNLVSEWTNLPECGNVDNYACSQCYNVAVAEWLGRGTPWSCWHYGVRKVVSSIPGRGNMSFSSDQVTGTVFPHLNMPFPPNSKFI